MSLREIYIGEWLIEVDREATEAAYLHENPISMCTCVYCENYFAACQAHTAFSPATFAFFQDLGIAPEKEAEVYAMYANPEKTHLFYGGFYHLVGRIIKAAKKWDYVPVDDQFGVFFSTENELISNHFPHPAIQMDFTGFIPWVLDDRREKPARLIQE